MKTCNKCNIEKQLDSFEIERNICKECRYLTKNRKRKSLNYSPDFSITAKQCTYCDQLHPIHEFTRCKLNKDGYTTKCKSCIKKDTIKNYKNNKEKIKKQTLSYYYNNREKVNEFRKKRQTERLKEDPNFKLIRRLRNRLYCALRETSWKKDTHFSEYIGCTLDELKNHIESKFTEGMTWELLNTGKIHLDHIIPLSSAKTEEELYKLCHFSNLQPLWAIDNIKKANKIE